MKIMTFNIQHGLDYKLRLEGIRKVNFEKIVEIINTYKPDIVSFNEVYNTGDELEFGEQIKKQGVIFQSDIFRLMRICTS